MAQFQKYIALSNDTAPGQFTISTTSASYVETAQKCYKNFDPTNYSGNTTYFQACFYTSAATGYSSLYTSAGSQVTGSEVTTTSTSAIRVRSSAITPSATDYTERIKNDGTNTTTINDGSIVIVQNTGLISVTETQVKMNANSATITSATYANFSTVFFSFFHYTAANWNGTVNIYYEANLATSASTGYSSLYTSAGSQVTGSEVTTTSTSIIRVRSSAITLTDNTDYNGRFKNDGTHTTTLDDCQVVIQQSGNPTATESFLQMGGYAYAATNIKSGHFIHYDNADWSVLTQSNYFETSLYANVGGGSTDLYNVTSAGVVTGSTVNPTNNSTTTRYRSSAMTMSATAQDVESEANSQSGTFYQANAWLIAVLTWVNASGDEGYLFTTNPALEQRKFFTKEVRTF